MDVYERAVVTHRVLLVHVRYLSPQFDLVPTVCCVDATWCGVHVVASCSLHCLRCVLLSLPALSVYQQNLTTRCPLGVAASDAGSDALGFTVGKGSTDGLNAGALHPALLGCAARHGNIREMPRFLNADGALGRAWYTRGR